MRRWTSTSGMMRLASVADGKNEKLDMLPISRGATMKIIPLALALTAIGGAAHAVCLFC
jgi:hypothetical protein